jgi:hypothetical protein
MKKTLLMAAAALAVSVISASAQVYSQNVVGYVNVPTAASTSTLLATPFTIGVTNGANEVFGTNLPPSSQILTWNGGGFTTTYFDVDPNGIGDSTHFWYMVDDSTITNAPVLPVGMAFMLIPNGSVTNTFAGAVAINVGTSNNVSFNPSVSYFVAPSVPYSGAVTNGNNSTGGLNLNSLPASSQVLFWNGAGFTTYYYDYDPNGIGDTTHFWYMVDDSTVTNTPVVTPGEGFVVIMNGSYTWTMGL